MQLYRLHEVPAELLNQLGGKAKGLYHLEKNGFIIPKTYVLCDIKETDDLSQVKHFFQELNMKKIAVRSSATHEDGNDFSSAGQYETFLNIDNEVDFEDAIRKCVASLNNETIQKYRSFFLQEKSKMTVVIQEMVEAFCAGVAFSSNPLGNHDDVVIEAVAGLGESLVSGNAQAEVHVINKVEPKMAATSLLNLDEVTSLYQDIVKAEKIWNTPLDLEWVKSESNQIIWLQARPITTLDEVTIDELDTSYEVDHDVITNHNVGEMLPGAITPLTISTVVYAIDMGLRKMLRIVRVAKSIEEIPAEMCISHYQGHLFFNMRYIYQMADLILGSNREQIDLGICGKVLETSYRDEPKKVNKFMKLLYTVRYFHYLLSRNKARKRVDHISKKLSFHLDVSMQELYFEIDKKQEILNDVLSDHYITSAHSGAMSTAIFTILKEDIQNVDEIKGMIASILEDIDDIESVDILRSLRVLARVMIEDNQEVINYDENQLLSYLKTTINPNVKYAYDSFLLKHGHRAVKEAELRSPGWKNNKLGLMNYLKMIISTNLEGNLKEKANENMNHILVNYSGGKKKALKYLMNQARIGCRNREYSKSRIIVAVDKFKTAYYALAEKMVQEGALPEIDLIYFLKHDEIGDLIQNKNVALIKKSLARRRLFKEQEALKFNSVNIGKPKPVILDSMIAVNGEILQGTPLSRGQVVGKARVVKSMDDAKQLMAGEIMVAGYTDIGWSPYYALIGGLITEVGSALSHGAVVAREYALPLVANITSATQKIRTGDIIAIDGGQGLVTILETYSK